MPPARSSARRNTPQSGAAISAPVKSSARSQSREEVTVESTTQAPGRRTRTTRQSSVESTNSVESRGERTTRSTRRVTKNAATVTDLDTVEEDPSDQLQKDAAAAALVEIAVRHPRKKTTRSAESDGVIRANPPPQDPPGEEIGEGYEALRDAPHTSPGRLSNISGTTAYSAEAAAEIDPQELIEDLPNLYREAQKLLELIIPDTAYLEDIVRIIAELQTPGSKMRKSLSKRERTLKPYFETFSSQSYIRSSTILRALFPTSYATLSGGDWRPDNLIYKANLAALSARISSPISVKDDKATFELLRDVDQSFPSQFLSSFVERDLDTVGSSLLLEATFKLGLEIRTQLAIAFLYQLQDDEDTNPLKVIAEIFLSPESFSEGASLEEILSGGDMRRWSIPSVNAEEVEDSFEQLTFHRIGRLRGFFQDAEDSEEAFDLDQLAEKFPWSKFAEQALTWIYIRNGEIEEVVKGESGADRIVNLLSQEITPRTSTGRQATGVTSSRERRNPRDRTDADSTRDTTLRESDMNDLNHLKDLERRVGAQQQQGDDWQPPVQEEDDAAAPNPGSSEKDQLASSAQLRGIMQEQRKQNKENLRRTQESSAVSPKRHFIDKQTGATRVQWEDGTGEPGTSQQAPAKPSQNDKGKGKRVREEDEEIENPTQDPGFAEEEDDEEPAFDPVKEPRRAVSPGKRQRIAEQTSPLRRADQTQRTSRPKTVNKVSQQQRETPAEPSAPESSARDPSTWSTQHSLINAQAKTRALLSTQARRQQTRTPWTAEEVDTFIDLIGELGCSWSAILKRDNDEARVLQNRSQVNLKDKAMNMKMDYLKVKNSMPPNFDQIPIRRQHIDHLLENGVFNSELEIKNWR